MRQYQLAGLVIILGLSGLRAVASPAVQPAPPPASACFSDYLESKQGFYAEANGGAIFFNGPNKDESNIFTGSTVGVTGPITGHPVGAFSTTDTTGSVGGTFGYVVAPHPGESWIGANLRAEVSGNYYQTSADGAANVGTLPASYVAVGRLDGANAEIVDPVISYSVAGAPVTPSSFTSVKFDSHDEIYDIDAVVKSDYFLSQGAFVFTPKVGLAYAHIDQRSSTFVTSPGAPNFANQEENLGTDYYGAKLGFELKANVSKSFVMFIDESTTLAYADANYEGNQQYASTFNATSVGTDRVTDSKSDFALREQVNAGVYYVFGPVIVKVSGGFDYWSDVSSVQEASPPTGGLLVGNTSVTPSHVAKTTMVNPQANVAVIVPF